MIFDLDGLTVYFPYDYLYPEQWRYMMELKRALDAQGHGCLEMPTGTGKTITLLSLITSYQLAHPECGKLVYCTRTVPEMEKVLAELRTLQAFREQHAGKASQILALGLSSRKNMCIHPKVAEEGGRDSVDANCRRLTASWHRERAIEAKSRGADVAATGSGPSGADGDGDEGEQQAAAPDIELCEFFEEMEKAGPDAILPPGVYTLEDLRAFGRRKKWCPYFLARHLIGVSNVVVYSYQYLLDPKVSGMVSKELERECIIVFDEAHNIDNVCIEDMSVNLRRQTIDAAARNVTALGRAVDRAKTTDADRLRAEYERLVAGLADQGALVTGGNGPASTQAAADEWLANPVIPADTLRDALPGNIRRAEHFIAVLGRFVEHLRARMSGVEVFQEAPNAFLTTCAGSTGIDGKTLRFCYERLSSLLKTLEIVDTEEYSPVSLVADFATLVGTYPEGFAIIFEPFDERMPNIPDPVLQLACLDASIAMKPVLERFRSVFITSGTLSPLELYPKLLSFHPVVCASLPMSLTRNCLCPLIVTRGADQLPISTKFDMRSDPGVVRNYGRLLVDLAAVVPDGIVCFFVSYRRGGFGRHIDHYMDSIVSAWHEQGVLSELLKHKLVFIETQDVVETSLALDNFRRACNAGRGAVFLSVARGKVAEGIDFDRHFGRAVVMFGVPYQYTLSRVLRARLEYLREKFQIRENDFLSFDALRQAAQCVGRVIRSKADYGLMVFADKRYNSSDKRGKLPGWITAQLKDAHLNLSTDMALHAAREFCRSMAQPYDRGEAGRTLLDQAAVDRLAGKQVAGGLPAGGQQQQQMIVGGVALPMAGASGGAHAG